MTDTTPQHAADPEAGPEATRTVRFWVVPIIITMAVLSALAVLYLGGSLNPQKNLRHFPIAVVNEDAGPAGAGIVKELVSGLSKSKYDFRVLSRDEALHQMDTAQVYGEAMIPQNFSAKLQAFTQSVVRGAPTERPVITIATNPRAGTLGASIAGQTLAQVMAVVDTNVGRHLAERVSQQAGVQLPRTVALALANPIYVQTVVHKPLPDGNGDGLSAFYYTLLLLLAGFTGSVVVSMLVDSMLGYVPTEFGPAYRFAERVNISRFRALLLKWALIVVLALLTSVAYMVIANGLGMPLPHGWALWLYGAFAIVAVGVTSTSLIAAFGSIGLLVSMFLFVVLGLRSAGATVPLQAAPPFFGWLARFEPMHQVFLGIRALLYLDGQASAGLSQALTLTTIGLLIGLFLGALVTRIYDRRGYHEIPSAVAAATTDEAASTGEDQSATTDEAASAEEAAGADEDPMTTAQESVHIDQDEPANADE